MLVLALSRNINDYPREALRQGPWHYVETLDQLRTRLEDPSDASWEKAYAIWRGDPPKIVDRHPNARMNAAIAEILVAAVRESDSWVHLE